MKMKLLAVFSLMMGALLIGCSSQQPEPVVQIPRRQLELQRLQSLISIVTPKLEEGDLAGAEAKLEEAYELASQIGNLRLMRQIGFTLAIVKLASGDVGGFIAVVDGLRARIRGVVLSADERFLLELAKAYKKRDRKKILDLYKKAVGGD